MFFRDLVARFLRRLYGLPNPVFRQRIARLPGVSSLYLGALKPYLFPSAGENGLAKVSFPTFVMYLDPKDTMGDMALGKAWEPATTHVFKQVIQPGDVVLDIGAHWGYFTLLAARLCGESGKVYAFEPLPMNFAMLAKNIAANKLTNVEAIQRAVSDQEGEARFFDRGSMGSSLNFLPSQGGASEGSAPRSVSTRTVRMDNYFAADAVHPRLIKIDVEGSEPCALDGMRNLLARNPQVVLITEFHPLYLDSAAAGKFLDALLAMGFEIAIIDDDRRQLEFAAREEILKRLLRLESRNAVNLLCTRGPEVPRRLLGTSELNPTQPRVVRVADS